MRGDVAKLSEDTLWKLWAADWFAKTGTPGLPTPDTKQWEGLRKMTALLADRSKPLGERFCAAHEVCRETFTAEKTQLPVILRALLILEGGVFGTVATKTYTNLLLKWAGKPELAYDDPAAITEALQNVAALIKEWSPKVDAVTVGKRARIAWHLSEIVKAELEETNPMPEPKDIAIAALKKMALKVGPDHEFPGDAIWEFADEEVEHGKRSPVFRSLSAEGYIEATGRMTKAVTPNRRSSPATEYRFGPLLKPRPSGAQLSKIVGEFCALCDGNLKVNQIVLTRLAAGLLSKRFLILTGLAGSGKTKLAQAFARWLTPLDSECVAVIPVGADWIGNENILGYPDGLRAPKLRPDGSVEEPGAYLSKPALALIQRALTPGNEHTPHFLILDEMNLSHVERYFADILSAIESGEPIPLHEDAERKADGRVVPRQLSLPNNLFIIGTVNVDETTYMFSPKVLDRANVIEFHLEVDEVATFLKTPVKPRLELLAGAGESFGKDFVDAASSRDATTPDTVKAEYAEEMLLFFNVLREQGAEFGYRVAHEAARFLYFYQQLGGFAAADKSWFNTAMDAVIIQKLLPKLHGSRSKLEGLLWALAWACGPERKEREGQKFPDQLAAAALAQDEAKFGPEAAVNALAGSAPRYPMSFDKVMRMWKKLVRDQFVTFAEA